MRDLIKDYIRLTKPWIMILLLITAFGGMVVAAETLPPVNLIVVVMFGGAMAAGGAGALNHALEQNVDRKMRRTETRPVAGGRISRRKATVFGLSLNVGAFVLLWIGANPFSAMLAISGTLLYVIVYTQWLKHSTVQNVVIGGAGGAIPPLVGWAAVTGGLTLPAYYLFAMVFFWTPPHFWALALLIKDDYAAAGVPMLPVVAGDAVARWAILLYSCLLLPLSILFCLSTESLGGGFLVGATVLGAMFIVYALRLWLNPSRILTAKVYRYSLIYLPLLFGLAMVDSVV
jgi:protoheme IX farnesyltransferase